MNALTEDLKRYGLPGKAVLGVLSLSACVLILSALAGIPSLTAVALLKLIILSLLIATTSARHPIQIPKTDTSVSVSEAVTFLGVIMLGPVYGAFLAALDMFLACRRLRLRPALFVFNISNNAVSIFLGGKAYQLVTGLVSPNSFSAGLTKNLLEFLLPLIALALAHYVIHIGLLTTVARVGGVKGNPVAKEVIAWEPVTYLAGAMTAGLLNYVLTTQGIIGTLVMLVLVAPVPVIVYYTFRTYRDKLAEQEEHYEELTGIYDSILEMLAMAIDAKDDVTHDHIHRVKLFARRMGERVGLTELEIEALKAGALLHDIGKIGVPAYILNKPGKLTEHEFEQMKMHTIIGADMLSNVDFRYPVVPIVRHHHERWDGKGYPDGLRGSEIPITARILTLVDNYDALRSDRPYHRAMSTEEACSYIRSNSGSFFDPQLVDEFLLIVPELESEAAAMKPSRTAMPARNRAMAPAGPAAGLASTPPVDRAAAALNSIAETNQRVTALYELSRTLSSILSVEDTIVILANRLSKLLPFTTCAISLFDASRSEFEIVHAAGKHADKLLKRRLSVNAGITGWVITNQRPMFNTNPVLDLGFLGPDVGAEYKGVIVYPLARNNEALGAIALYSDEIETYGAEHIQLMESISQPASDAVYNARAFEEAQRSALIDQVTGLATMRALTAQFERERGRGLRKGTPISLLIVSLDNIDQIKEASAELIGAAGKVIAAQLRGTDLVARQSSNRLLLLLPESGLPETTEVRTRIRRALKEHFEELSVNMGSACIPGDGESFDELLDAAKMDCSASREMASTGF